MLPRDHDALAKQINQAIKDSGRSSEPPIALITAFTLELLSIADSLKRIADILEKVNQPQALLTSDAE